MSGIGILCGLRMEAAHFSGTEGIVAMCSAARHDSAKAIARGLVGRGAKMLASFGLAGGLAPGHPPGTIIIAVQVMADGASFRCDEKTVETLGDLLPQAVLGSVLDTGSIIQSHAAKRNLRARTGCLAADMESGAVAVAAQEAGIPFFAVRVVLDDCDTSLPPAAIVPLRNDGSTDMISVLSSIISQPSQIPALLGLGKSLVMARRGLEQAARAIVMLRRPD